MMNRFALTKRLTDALHPEDAVVGGIGNTHFDLWAAGQRPTNFYMLGSMGLACPIALGVALAQPQRRVIAIEGDGSLLMQLGCLTTIAVKQPANLTILVMDNAMYQITGGQRTATAAGADFVQIARGAGLAESAWAHDEQEFDRLLQSALDRNAPSLIAARTDKEPPRAVTDRDPTYIRHRFMQALKNDVSS